MPVKRRASKRKPAISAEAFAVVFQTGFDFFSDLAPFGLREPVHVSPADREAARAAWDAALRDAWAKHGHDFMRTHEPGQRTPWAVKAFGLPEDMGETSCR